MCIISLLAVTMYIISIFGARDTHAIIYIYTVKKICTYIRSHYLFMKLTL